jgi:AraC-type transcriptional regulator N-terminus
VLRPAAIAPLLIEAPAGRWSRTALDPAAIVTGQADLDLLDAVARLLRLLDHLEDAAGLAPLIEREILWRLLTGPHGGMIRQTGLADSGLSHVSRAIRWIRDNYAEPMRISDLARLAVRRPAGAGRRAPACRNRPARRPAPALTQGGARVAQGPDHPLRSVPNGAQVESAVAGPAVPCPRSGPAVLPRRR